MAVGLISHTDLLAKTRSLRLAAGRDDVVGVHTELFRLRSALVDHLNAERGDFAVLPDNLRAVAIHGQDQVLRLIDDLLAAVDADHDCTCIVRAIEVDVALQRQARLEQAILTMTPPTRGA
ncbi:MAG: hypothetical protein KF906_12445 [Actinobacteria bacterium]|nr:hypothetical protein [Actinomycetota bacterium]